MSLIKLHYLLAQTITDNKVNVPKTDLGSNRVEDVLQLFFSIAGAVALLVIIIGALQYTISRGDANSIKKAKETIIYAVVGLVLCITGYGIVTFVMGRL